MSRTPTPLSPGAIVNTLGTVAAKGKPQSVFLKEASPCADGVFGKHNREPAPTKRVPDTEPERRAQRVGAGTSSSK